MIEEQIQFKVLIADLNSNLLANERETVSKLHQKLSQVQEKSGLEVCLAVSFWKIEKFQKIAVFEDTAVLSGKTRDTVASFNSESIVLSNADFLICRSSSRCDHRARVADKR